MPKSKKQRDRFKRQGLQEGELHGPESIAQLTLGLTIEQQTLDFLA